MTPAPRMRMLCWGIAKGWMLWVGKGEDIVGQVGCWW